MPTHETVLPDANGASQGFHDPGYTNVDEGIPADESTTCYVQKDNANAVNSWRFADPTTSATVVDRLRVRIQGYYTGLTAYGLADVEISIGNESGYVSLGATGTFGGTTAADGTVEELDHTGSWDPSAGDLDNIYVRITGPNITDVGKTLRVDGADVQLIEDDAATAAPPQVHHLTQMLGSADVQKLKQSTAVTLKFGPFLDEDDGKTAETTLTISQADVRLSKNGGNYAQKNESSSATHDELGKYDVDLDTTDTNTLGYLEVSVHEAGALPVHKTYEVVPANEYDDYFNATLIAGSVNDGSPTTTGFVGDSNLSSQDNQYKDMIMEFTSGNLDGVSNKITGYTGTSRTFAFTNAWPQTPANSDTFRILGYSPSA